MSGKRFTAIVTETLNLKLGSHVLNLILSAIFIVSCGGGNKEGAESPSSEPSSTVPAQPAVLPVVVLATGSNSFISNASTLTISGTCYTGATVVVSGDDSATAICSAANFSTTVSKATDGNWNFSILQRFDGSISSPAISLTWTRDTAAPALVTVSNPAVSPIYSSNTSMVISGSCENGATVKLFGSAVDSVTCGSNTYSFSFSKSVDATYDFVLTQSDSAGNTSASKSIQWIRSSDIPTTPEINSPAVISYYSNGSSLTISGSCTTGYSVELSGSATNSMACNAAAFSINVSNNTDGTYGYSVLQKSNSGVPSAQASISWIRDTSVPASVVLSVPATSPNTSSSGTLTLAGSCESGSSVDITGSASASTSCTSGAFSTNITKSVDGSYTFNLSQTDIAGNVSNSISHIWTLDTVSPSTPTIVSPSKRQPMRSANGCPKPTAHCGYSVPDMLTGAFTSLRCAVRSHRLGPWVGR